MNADVADTLIRSSKELTACRRGDSQPVSGCQLRCFTINYGFAASGSDEVNFFVFLVIMYERYTGTCREMIYTDFRSRQMQLVMQLTLTLSKFFMP